MRHLYKILCSLLVTVGFVLLPLPTLADTPDPATDVTTTTTSAVVNTTGSSATTAETTTTSPSETAISSSSTDGGQGSTTSSTTLALQPVATANATVTLQNNTSATAQSGEAAISGNSTGGNATSGGAISSATVLNIANANGTTTPKFSSFTCDVTGDSEGDLLIDPASLLPICSTTTVGTSAQSTTSTEGLQTGASLVDILNTIALSATSGNATISGNDSAGNATTGNAATLANIVNLANTNITSKNAFLGIINIFGNLKGNILVPQSLVSGLMGNSGSVPANGIDTTSITNAVNANATSGSASVTANGSAGDATTGDAATSVTVLNLTGQQVVAKNSLLVFVNVLGKWMGLIVPAPGSKTATLGSGLQEGAGGISQPSNTNDTVSITNDITLNSHSGDASVSENESAGDATSGSAQAGANILNITNSNFLLDDWFGALFINVLGSWLGNFDIQAALAQQGGDDSTDGQSSIVQDVQVYQFTDDTPIDMTDQSSLTTALVTTSPQVNPTNQDTGHVLDASTNKPQNSTTNAHSAGVDFLTLAGLIMAFTIIIASGTIGLRRKFLI